MANWHGTTRTNYVHVPQENVDRLREFLKRYGWTMTERTDEGYAFLEEFGEGLPGIVEDDDLNEIDFLDTLVGMLAPDQILVVMEAGAEKQRYITGVGIAIHTTTGERAEVSISDIYQRVMEKWPGQPYTQASY